MSLSRHLEGSVSKGITDKVLTIYSGYRVEDVIDGILDVKVKAVMDWVKSLDIEISTVFIIGIYLTGMGLARAFGDKAIAYDKERCLRKLVKNFGFVKKADLVIDTTGIGGIERLDVEAKAVVVESPISDGSDDVIRQYNVYERLKDVKAEYKGILKTFGLKAKTSGTMTLTLEVLRRCAESVLSFDGVLYAVPAMDYYEGLIFHKKDVDAFLKAIERPALVVSSLRPVNCDEVIRKHLSMVKSVVYDVD